MRAYASQVEVACDEHGELNACDRTDRRQHRQQHNRRKKEKPKLVSYFTHRNHAPFIREACDRYARKDILLRARQRLLRRLEQGAAVLLGPLPGDEASRAARHAIHGQAHLAWFVPNL